MAANSLIGRLALRATLLALSLGAIHVALAAAENYAVRLTRVPIEASNRAEITGAGSATAALDGTKLKLRGSFTGLKGAATTAQLHEGAVKGVRGPAIADFPVPQAVSGAFEADLTLTAAQAESLRQGRLYLQIQSTSAPDGNLWGWLLK